MKTMMSKISIIGLSLMAMTFTFVLGTTSSNAVGDGNSFEQCVGYMTLQHGMPSEYGSPEEVTSDMFDVLYDVLRCAEGE